MKSEKQIHERVKQIEVILKSHEEQYKNLHQIDMLSGTGHILINYIVADKASIRMLNWVLNDSDNGGIVK
jgi:hypothetical protein